MKNKNKGFSLIELMVAMAVLAIISLALVQSFNAISKNIQKNTGEVETSKYLNMLSKEITRQFHDSYDSLYTGANSVELSESIQNIASADVPTIFGTSQYSTGNPLFGNVIFLGGFAFNNPFSISNNIYIKKYLFLSHYNEGGNNINMNSNLGIMTLRDDNSNGTPDDDTPVFKYLATKTDRIFIDNIKMNPSSTGSWSDEVNYQFTVRHFSTKTRQQEATY